MKYEANAGPPKGDHPTDRAINAMPFPQYPIAPPVAADSVDTEEFSALAARYGNSKAGKDYMALVANAAAWGAQQREAEKLKVEQSVVLAVDQAHQQAKDAKDLANELRQRAEKAEAQYKIVCDKNHILRKYCEAAKATEEKWQGKAEKAEADLKARDFFVDVLNCQVKKAQGEADVLFHRLNAANGHLAMARERIEELETEIKVQHRG